MFPGPKWISKTSPLNVLATRQLHIMLVRDTISSKPEMLVRDTISSKSEMLFLLLYGTHPPVMIHGSAGYRCIDCMAIRKPCFPYYLLGGRWGVGLRQAIAQLSLTHKHHICKKTEVPRWKQSSSRPSFE